MQTNFGTGNIGKLLLQQAIPASLGILILSVYTLVDTIFIGQYIGGIGIAAVTIVAPIIFLVSSIGLGIGIGGGALISIELGKDQLERAKQVFGNQVIMVAVISLLILGIGFQLFTPILEWFGGRGQVLVAAQEYFYYALLGLPFFMGQMMLNNVLRAEGKANLAMLVLGLPAIINIALDIGLIVGLEMGLSGAALATAIAQVIGVVIGLIFMLKYSEIQPTLKQIRLDKKLVLLISQLGATQFLSQASMSIIVVVVNNLLMHYGGDLAISAYGLVLRIMMFAFFPVMGIVQGFMPLAGYNFGAGKIDRVRAAIRLSFISSTLIAIVILIIAVIFTREIISVFTNEADLLALSTVVMLWFISAYPLLGIQQVSTSYFQAIGKAKPALWLTLTKQFILLPTLFLFPIWFSLNGLWYSIPFSEVATTGIAFYFFRKEIQTKN